jgi:RNA polymerase sigma factor (TIGR02999 family)
VRVNPHRGRGRATVVRKGVEADEAEAGVVSNVSEGLPAEADEADDGAPPSELSAEAYRHLRRIARARLRHGGREMLLDTTALVHEAYLRLVATGADLTEQNRFMAYTSRAMRSVIVDHARKRQAACRGGDAVMVTLTGAMEEGEPAAADDIVRVHEALGALSAIDTRLAQVVEMRYFGGLIEPQIARALGISERTVRRDWEKARLLLSRLLSQ